MHEKDPRCRHAVPELLASGPGSCGGGESEATELRVDAGASASAVERRREGTLHSSAEGSGEGTSMNPPCDDAVRCLSCQGLAQSWPQFVSYLSVSRINVNVRQVVSQDHVF